MAFCGIPAPSVDICIGALPAATFNTAMENRKKKVIKIHKPFKREIKFVNYNRLALLMAVHLSYFCE